ncbi:uncharacterized protein Pyn_29130 [Prunus yedoensis var. nudiflora]|uniref:Uncharacterized protein n=1 Tax=Prunus yedoensis var. nudiflora TaxID=2094558 RepID=A0A314XQE8_PRUYE|nr:uncharacterized protein Pyn_29130 [Prunus yedoensis var. nudiflora]
MGHPIGSTAAAFHLRSNRHSWIVVRLTEANVVASYSGSISPSSFCWLVYVTEESSVFSKAFFCGTETVSKMNHFNVQHQNASFMGCEDIRGSAFISDTKDLCSHQSEFCDSKAGAELLDLILRKEGYGLEQSLNEVASSPPYFCGSPPSRAANPLIQDARFGDEKLTPVSASPSPSTLSSHAKQGSPKFQHPSICLNFIERSVHRRAKCHHSSQIQQN